MKVNIGKGIELDIDTTKFSPDVAAHVMYIGLRNVLMDSHASITKDTNPNDMQDVARAVAEKKLAAMLAGEVRVAGTREGDPIRAEAIRLATKAITIKLRAAGRQMKSVDPKALRAKAVELSVNYLEQAIANVNAAKALATDLGDIEL